MLTAACLTLAAVVFVADKPTPLPLYSGPVPMSVGDSDADKPTLTPYLVPGATNAAAVVVCPGGGYGFLADDHEGVQPAKYLNSLGVHAFVLKYRIATKGRPGPLMGAPLLDAQRALRTVRARATEFGVDPKRVGIWGFSAGGHLASTAATHFDAGKVDSGDAVERAGCRPDFAILAYPVITMDKAVTHGGSRANLIGADPSPELVALYSNDERVTAETPPTFLFQTDDDAAVRAENAVRFYLALRKHKVPAELHVYAKGPHGVGLGTDPKWTKGVSYPGTWTQFLTAWLRLNQLAPSSPVKD